MTTRRWVDEHGREIEESDRGLVYDLQTLVDRRKVLGLFGGLSAVVLLAACGGSGSGTPSGSDASASGATTSSSGSGDLTEVPEETAGPFPADRSNGPNVLDDSGIVRSDIRSSFGSSTTTAEGVPLTIRLTVRDAATGDAAKGAGVYLLHCDRDGNYSLYSQAAANENYQRGAQEADAGGTVTFQSIFPACYSGRWPHIHFEVYDSLSDATSSGPIVRTSQIALPTKACGRCTRPPATSRAWPTCPRSAWPATWSSATTAPSTSSPACPGTPRRATPPRSPSASDPSGG